MENWLSAEPGMSPADIDHNPSGQRDDNRRGGKEAVEKGRSRTAVGGYTINSTQPQRDNKFCVMSIPLKYAPTD